MKISITPDNTVTYPLHSHSDWEIMFYLEGEGALRTHLRDYPFSSGAAIIVPPDIAHGSTSEKGFRNISIGGDFSDVMLFNEPKTVVDTSGDSRILAELILKNRHSDEKYKSTLLRAYLASLMQNMEFESAADAAVDAVCRALNAAAFDSSLQPAELLRETGYAEDYIRQHFKVRTGTTPIKYLTALRLERARALLEIYKQSVSLSKIGELCGFTDYVYFCKQFKRNFGVSPREYVKNIK